MFRKLMSFLFGKKKEEEKKTEIKIEIPIKNKTEIEIPIKKEVEVEVFNSLDDLFSDKVEQNIPTNQPIVIDKKPITQLKMRSDAMEKIFCMAENCHTECYCLLVGRGDVVFDIIIPRQHGSAAFVSVDGKAVFEASKRIPEGYNVLGWAHSHAKMGVFFSGTDYENQNRLLNETSNKLEQLKFVYGMTVNIKRDCVGFVTTQYKDGASEIIKSTVYIIPVETDFEGISIEYKKQVREYVVNGYEYEYSKKNTSSYYI